MKLKLDPDQCLRDCYILWIMYLISVQDQPHSPLLQFQVVSLGLENIKKR